MDRYPGVPISPGTAALIRNIGMMDNSLPLEIYQVDSIRFMEKQAMTTLSISENTLMLRAAEAAFKVLRQHFEKATDICIVCGGGNNAGDGYYLAKLIKEAGLSVEIFYLLEPSQLTGAARWAYEEASAMSIEMRAFSATMKTEADLIVDAIFGTGLSRRVEDIFLEAIMWINDKFLPTLALDIPSGIAADTGTALGNAVIADATITFLGLKSGLMTGEALDYVGHLFFDDLQLPSNIFEEIPAYALRLSYDDMKEFLLPRFRNAHKGECGHVLIVGGDYGMAGAVCMTANAALRAGAGLVSVITHQEHVAGILGFHPEVMVYSDEKVNWEFLLSRSTVIVIGPGLGKSAWSEEMYLAATKVASDIPVVIDADGLYFLKKHPLSSPMILTPHPGEAAQLLEMSVADIQLDRYGALQKMNEKYPTAACLLKGAGSLVLDEAGIFGVCTAGNPGMATAGMGDILTGIIAGLLAEGRDRFFALAMGVLLHGMAGDEVAFQKGQRGMMATDLLPMIQELVNPYANNFTH